MTQPVDYTGTHWRVAHATTHSSSITRSTIEQITDADNGADRRTVSNSSTTTNIEVVVCDRGFK